MTEGGMVEMTALPLGHTDTHLSVIPNALPLSSRTLSLCHPERFPSVIPNECEGSPSTKMQANTPLLVMAPVRTNW
jgi:hypothetical protein